MSSSKSPRIIALELNPDHHLKPLGSATAAPSEIRKHYYLDRYVIIAPKRNLRPDAISSPTRPHASESAKEPVLENDPSIFEIKDDAGHWQIKVVANLFPALALDNPKGYGKHEIVIDTPEHNIEFSELPVEQIERVFEAYRERTEALYAIEGIRYVEVFKNDGPKAGASIAHAHSQIIALPMVPPNIVSEQKAFEDYFKQHQSCPVCDLARWEVEQKHRLIWADEFALAIAPYAASSPYGVWVITRQHRARFAELNQDELRSFATVIKQITGKLDSVDISFNYFLQDALPETDHHFILKVEPRPNIRAGFELGTGVTINQIPPEFAARWYKNETA